MISQRKSIYCSIKYLCLLCLFVYMQAAAAGMDGDSLFFIENYTKSEYQIQMRDGIKLFTAIYSPKDSSDKYPILILRTPYDVRPYGAQMDFPFNKIGLHPEFLREKFIFVFQDVRGRFMSEGNFRHMTPFVENKQTAKDVDESSDAYDTIDWLIKNLKNHNGRAGLWGISYPGFYASCAAINAHPALKCVSPQAPIGDWYYDDVHHHGALALPIIELIAAMGLPRYDLTKEWLNGYNFKSADGYSFYMNLEPLRRVKEKYFGDSIAFWNEVVNHPDYDEYWQKLNILPHLKNITPAVMVVGGWYDAEDLYGTFKTYKNIEINNPETANTLVIGPWIHGGWARTDGSFLGNVSFGMETAVFYRDSIELPFFKYYLKDKGLLNLPEAIMFMTGKNEWKKFDKWPPDNAKQEKLYLHANSRLDFNPPQSNEPLFDEYISDPSKPVPYTEDIFRGMTKEYMTDDQRFAARRPDVLVYATETLNEDITIAGPLTARLKVSTTGSDADWIVKLVDVYPVEAPDNPKTRAGRRMSEYQQMVRSEIIRGRYRKSYENPEPFKPGKIEEVNLELQDILHCFKKGHKIMVQIQSTWFPLFDLNPQKYVKNIYKAKSSDFIKAFHRVYHGPEEESFIEISILK
ncbi:MAG: CocE/NonD family hydrolase [Bacteroidetes bacterium]|nr:CocE/NonD family hydrolase [Bacteroidota bacterium]